MSAPQPARAATIRVVRSAGSGLRNIRSTRAQIGSISRPACSVRFSEPSTTASTATPSPTSRQITTTVRSVPLIGASEISNPIAAMIGRASFTPIEKMPPAATASVASPVVRPHDVSIW